MKVQLGLRHTDHQKTQGTSKARTLGGIISQISRTEGAMTSHEMSLGDAQDQETGIKAAEKGAGRESGHQKTKIASVTETELEMAEEIETAIETVIIGAVEGNERKVTVRTGIGLRRVGLRSRTKMAISDFSCVQVSRKKEIETDLGGGQGLPRRSERVQADLLEHDHLPKLQGPTEFHRLRQLQLSPQNQYRHLPK